MADESFQRLGASAGFEIARSGEVIFFAQRGTRPAALTVWIGGGLSALAGVHAILWPVLALAGKGEMGLGLRLGVGFGLAALLLFFVARAGYRRYRRLRDAAIDEVPGFRADLKAGTLLREGRKIAKLADLQIDTPRNLGDSTQGSMRWVRLRWPGGSARVYSASSKEAESIASRLVEAGIGARSR